VAPPEEPAPVDPSTRPASDEAGRTATRAAPAAAPRAAPDARAAEVAPVAGAAAPHDPAPNGGSRKLIHEVVDLFEGRLGQPHGGWPKKVQKIVLKDRKPLKGRPADALEAVDLEEVRAELKGKIKSTPNDADLLSYLMYPGVFPEFDHHRKQFSDTSALPTEVFFYGMKPGQEIAVELDPGKTLIIKFIAVGEPDSEGTRPIFFELNGAPRTVRVQDKTLKATKETRPKADPENPGHIAAPMPGKVVQVVVSVGEQVARGQKLLSIEAMKMETSVYSPIAARVREVNARPGLAVEAKDLLLTLDPLGDGTPDVRR